MHQPWLQSNDIDIQKKPGVPSKNGKYNKQELTTMEQSARKFTKTRIVVIKTLCPILEVQHVLGYPG